MKALIPRIQSVFKRNKSKRVFICEPEFTTHYHFIQHLIPKLSEEFGEVLVGVMSDADRDAHYLNTLKVFEGLDNVTVLKQFEPMPRISDTRAREEGEDQARSINFAKLIEVLEQGVVDHLVALSADKLIPMFAQHLNGDAAGVLSRIKLHLGVHWMLPQPFPVQAETDALSSHQRSVSPVNLASGGNEWNEQQVQARHLLALEPETLMFQNLLAVQAARQYLPSIADNTYLNPVPIEVFPPLDKQEARQLLDFPRDGRIIGFTGSIQNRKGIPQFLHAFRLAGLNSNDKAVLFGPFDDYEIKGIVQDRYQDLVDEGLLLIRDEILDVQSIHVAISAFDVLVCNLNHHQWASDMALRAMVAERTILAADESWFSYMVRKFESGTLVSNPDDPEAVACAIRESLDRSAHFKTSKKAKALCSFNDPSNYAELVIKAMFHKNGAYSADSYDDWLG